MDRERIHIRVIVGMNRSLPSTALDPNVETGVVIPRELVDIAPWKLPRVVPRPADRFHLEKTSADPNWPRWL